MQFRLGERVHDVTDRTLVMGVLNIPLNGLNWVSALTLVSLTGYVLA